MHGKINSRVDENSLWSDQLNLQVFFLVPYDKFNWSKIAAGRFNAVIPFTNRIITTGCENEKKKKNPKKPQKKQNENSLP